MHAAVTAGLAPARRSHQSTATMFVATIRRYGEAGLAGLIPWKVEPPEEGKTREGDKSSAIRGPIMTTIIINGKRGNV